MIQESYSEQPSDYAEFITLDAHTDYKITTTFPFVIRRKKDGKIMKQSLNNAGYFYVSINGKSVKVHRIIAEQFVSNNIFDKFPLEIDHINGNKANNRTENLRWITHADNLKCRRSHAKHAAEYIDSLDDLRIIPLTQYGDSTFDRYFYDKDNEKLYLKTRAKRTSKNAPQNYRFKLIKPCSHNNLKIITLLTVDGKTKSYGYNKFMKHCKQLCEISNK